MKKVLLLMKSLWKKVYKIRIKIMTALVFIISAVIMAIIKDTYVDVIKPLLIPSVGSISISCNLDSACIFINDSLWGYTSKFHKTHCRNIKPGKYGIRIYKPYFHEKYESVQVIEGQNSFLKMLLDSIEINEAISFDGYEIKQFNENQSSESIDYLGKNSCCLVIKNDWKMQSTINADINSDDVHIKQAAWDLFLEITNFCGENAILNGIAISTIPVLLDNNDTLQIQKATTPYYIEIYYNHEELYNTYILSDKKYNFAKSIEFPIVLAGNSKQYIVLSFYLSLYINSNEVSFNDIQSIYYYFARAFGIDLNNAQSGKFNSVIKITLDLENSIKEIDLPVFIFIPGASIKIPQENNNVPSTTTTLKGARIAN